MTAAYQQILEVLVKHLSPSNAEGTLVRSMREANMRADTFTLAELPQLLPSLERRIRLYVDPVRQARISQELNAQGMRPTKTATMGSPVFNASISRGISGGTVAGPSMAMSPSA